MTFDIDIEVNTIERAVAYEYSPSPLKTVQELRKQYQVIVELYRDYDGFTDEQMKALRFAMAAMTEALHKRGSYDD